MLQPSWGCTTNVRGDNLIVSIDLETDFCVLNCGNSTYIQSYCGADQEMPCYCGTDAALSLKSAADMDDGDVCDCMESPPELVFIISHAILVALFSSIPVAIMFVLFQMGYKKMLKADELSLATKTTRLAMKLAHFSHMWQTSYQLIVEEIDDEAVTDMDADGDVDRLDIKHARKNLAGDKKLLKQYHTFISTTEAVLETLEKNEDGQSMSTIYGWMKFFDKSLDTLIECIEEKEDDRLADLIGELVKPMEDQSITALPKLKKSNSNKKIEVDKLKAKAGEVDTPAKLTKKKILRNSMHMQMKNRLNARQLTEHEVIEFEKIEVKAEKKRLKALKPPPKWMFWKKSNHASEANPSSSGSVMPVTENDGKVDSLQGAPNTTQATSEENDRVSEALELLIKEEKGVKTNRMAGWVINTIAYIFCGGYIMFTSLFIVTYALQYGPVVSKLWLQDFFRAFVLDFGIMDPISIMFKGIVVQPFVALVVMPRIKAYIESKKNGKVVPEPGEEGSSASLSFTGMNSGLLTVDEVRRASTTMGEILHATARRASTSLFPGNKTAVAEFADRDASENASELPTLASSDDQAALEVNAIEEHVREEKPREGEQTVQETGAAAGAVVVEDVHQIETSIAQENKNNADDAILPKQRIPGPPALASSDGQAASEVDVVEEQDREEEAREEEQKTQGTDAAAGTVVVEDMDQVETTAENMGEVTRGPPTRGPPM